MPKEANHERYIVDDNALEVSLTLPESLLDQITSSLNNPESDAPLKRKPQTVRLEFKELTPEDFEEIPVHTLVEARVFTLQNQPSSNQLKVEKYRFDAILEGYGNILKGGRVASACHAIGAITLLSFMGTYSAEEKASLINEVYRLNADIEEKIIEKLETIRFQYENLIKSSH